MLEERVEKQLQSFMGDLEGQVRTYLQWCESPIERLLLLEFMRLPGAQPTRCVGAPDPERIGMFSGGLLDSAKGLPVGEGDSGSWAPTGLAWLDGMQHHRLFYNEEESECCRLIPKFRVNDEESGVSFNVDLAFFRPRLEDGRQIKIAIEFENNGYSTIPDEPARTKRDLLQKMGWIVIGFSESDIVSDPKGVMNKIEEIALDAEWRQSKRRRMP
jgi:hypothetical protein